MAGAGRLLPTCCLSDAELAQRGSFFDATAAAALR